MTLTTDQWIQLFVAIGTIAVAILAIWGQQITHFLGLGPKLQLQLPDPLGEIIISSTGGGRVSKIRYYHVKVRNSHKWTQATNVRVVISEIARPAADGTYSQQQLVGPLQLMWRFAMYHPQYSVLGSDEICDLGYVSDKKFVFSTFGDPTYFLGTVEPNQRVRIEIKALANNAESRPFYIDISWDGSWSEDTIQMANHLVIKEVPSMDSNR